MTDQPEASSSSAKRAREEVDDQDVPDMPSGDVEDSSDEEIGPMPGFIGEQGEGVKTTNGRKKKRRAGLYLLSPS